MDLNRQPSNPKPQKKEIRPSIDKVPDVRQTSNAKKFFGNFIASDAADVKDYVIMNVLLPRAKALLLDMIRNSAEMLIMGPSGVSRGRTNYSNYGTPRNGRDYTSNSGSTMRPANTYVTYPDPLFEVEDDAWRVIEDMVKYVADYPYINISEFLQFAGRPKDDEYTYINYGWSADTIRGSTPEQIPDGRFVIRLPRPIYIR